MHHSCNDTILAKSNLSTSITISGTECIDKTISIRTRDFYRVKVWQRELVFKIKENECFRFLK